MAKFIKFRVANNVVLTGGGDYSRDVLVNVDDIENVADAVSGAGVYTTIVTLKGIVGLEAGHANDAAVPAGTIGGRILTLTLSTSATAAANPTAITVAQNMPSQSIVRALTANPGGVAASAQLSKDGAGLVANNQMYWSSAIFSSNNAI
jgi:hypothetical protein